MAVEMTKLSARLYVLPVVLDEDALHLNLAEKDIALLGALLLRDPSAGRLDGNGHRVMAWQRHYQVTFHVAFAGGDLDIYVMRIKPNPKAPRTYGEAKATGKRLVIGVIQHYLNKLLEASE